jgi:hypothetical protein
MVLVNLALARDGIPQQIRDHRKHSETVPAQRGSTNEALQRDAAARQFGAARPSAPMSALGVCKGVGDYQEPGFTCVPQQRPFVREDKIWFSISIKNLSSGGQQIRHVYYKAELEGTVERGQFVKGWKKIRENLGPRLPRGDTAFYMRAHKTLSPGLWKAEIFVGDSAASVIMFCIEHCPAQEG